MKALFEVLKVAAVAQANWEREMAAAREIGPVIARKPW